LLDELGDQTMLTQRRL